MSAPATTEADVYHNARLTGAREPVTLAEDLMSLTRKTMGIGQESSNTATLLNQTIIAIYNAGAGLIANADVAGIAAGDIVEIVSTFTDDGHILPVIQKCTTAKSTEVMGVVAFIGAPLTESAIPSGLSMTDFLAVKDLYTLVVLKSGGSIPVRVSNSGGAIPSGQFLETDTGGALVAQSGNNFVEHTVAKSLHSADFSGGSTTLILAKF